MVKTYFSLPSKTYNAQIYPPQDKAPHPQYAQDTLVKQFHLTW